MNTHEQRGEISGMPCLAFSAATAPVGQIVLLHGWGSTMDSYAFFASQIAGWGRKVIVPELPWHGERGTLDYWKTETLQTRFWEVVLQGVREVDAIAAELSSESELPVTVIGHSAGGFIAAGVHAGSPHIASSVVINGSCAWIRFEELLRESSGLPPMEPGDRAAMSPHDPMNRILSGPAKPLLLLHGLEDTIVPIGSQQYFADELAKRPGSADFVQFHTFERLNHVITLGMLQRIHAFLGGAS
ncbi:alpha/beta hydrolase [Paenibacillus sacheonensis]|uniref:Alpha/beta fold hydrolase n=1 Tax=Paenibacillus sacheonensis TaxID=742054 RepID=A0A7X4YSR0_9BACL|nr:alpha/beta fold hydrolase [Paenibacillus sacheonensis]MBM7568202.1 alpha-beta hydrolase superfamily lysophospholipase [Paenibacillus sacheonensis]NBC71800.1 alpha/beta fold hydrolase [Paenibacillus sacheonensis]